MFFLSVIDGFIIIFEFQFDARTRKTFLRRTKCDNVSIKDLYVGNVVTIFSRAMKLTDVADEATKNKIGKTLQKFVNK